MNRTALSSLLVAPLTLAAAACHRDPPSTPTDVEPSCVPDEAPWPDPVTTLSRRQVLDPPGAIDPPLATNPAWPDGLALAEDQGLGGVTDAPGEPWRVRTELVPGWTPPAASGRRSLWMVLHQTDAQLADVESPTRLAAADQIGATQSAARPQELYAIHALDAQIRAANALSALAPIDFAVATGDNADNNQRNELAWFAAVWDGLPVHPDAGEDDAQPDVDCRDPLDPFTPVGAAFPWYATAGNHDVLIQGNFDNGPFEDDALGEVATGGTRDLTLPGGPLTFVTAADPDRAVLERGDIAAMLLDTPATPGPVGHGFTDANVRDGTVGWSATPVDGVPVRLIAVDANPPGIGSPELSATERDTWLLPELEAAEDRGELVVVTSHYALGTVEVEGGGTVGDLLLQHPNVVLVLAGHSHMNRIRVFGEPGDPGAFWQIETSATVDWPAQGRLVELVDNGDGTLSIVATLFDTPAPPGSLSARAAYLTRIDVASGWQSNEGEGEPTDRNVELVQPLPVGWTTTAGGPMRSPSLP